MVVRCSNPVGFVVIVDDTETRTGIHLAVYDGDDPATQLDLLPDTWDRRWHDELNGPGSGSFRVHADNPRLAATPGLLAYGNVVRFNLDRRDRFAIQIENVKRDQVVGPDGVSRRALTVTGRGVLSKLEEALAYPQIDGNPTRGFPGITPGHLATVLLDEAAARSALTGIVWDFTADLDSHNAPWTSELYQTERAGTDLLRIARRIAELAADVYMTPTGVFRIFNTRGFDRSVPIDTDEAVILRPGANVVELTREEDGAIRNVLLIETPAGFVERADPTSLGTYRRREAFLSVGNAEDAAQIDMVADSVFRRSSAPAAHLTLEISDAVTYPRPYWHFDVGDWVLAPDDDGTLTRYRVRGLSISESVDGRHIFVVPELSTVTEELDLRLERWLSSMARGTLGGVAAGVTEPVRESAEVTAQIVTVAGETVTEHEATTLHATTLAQLAAKSLDDLDDVDVTGAPDGRILKKVSGVWQDAIEAAGGGAPASRASPLYTPAAAPAFDMFDDLAGFTIVEDTSPNLTVATDAQLQRVSIRHPGGDSAAEQHGVVWAFAPAGDFWLEGALDVLRAPGNHTVVGLVAADGVTYGAGVQLAWCLNYQGPEASLRRMANWNAQSAANTSRTLTAPGTAPVFWRLAYNATTNVWTPAWSSDGLLWHTQTTLTWALTVSRVGFTFSSWGGAVPFQASARYLQAFDGTPP